MYLKHTMLIELIPYHVWIMITGKVLYLWSSFNSSAVYGKPCLPLLCTYFIKSQQHNGTNSSAIQKVNRIKLV